MKKILLAILLMQLTSLYSQSLFDGIDFTTPEPTLKLNLARHLALYDIQNEKIDDKMYYIFLPSISDEYFDHELKRLTNEEVVVKRMIDLSSPILFANDFHESYIVDVCMIAMSIEQYYIKGCAAILLKDQ